MDYMAAWREGHKEGMALTLKLINEFTGQEFQTASEVVLYIKELESQREANFYKNETAMNSLAQKIAINNWHWKN